MLFVSVLATPIQSINYVSQLLIGLATFNSRSYWLDLQFNSTLCKVSIVIDDYAFWDFRIIITCNKEK